MKSFLQAEMSRRSTSKKETVSPLQSIKKSRRSPRAATLTRNYVGEEKILRSLRSSDFDELYQHDGRELRSEVCASVWWLFSLLVEVRVVSPSQPQLTPLVACLAGSCGLQRVAPSGPARSPSTEIDISISLTDEKEDERSPTANRNGRT